MFKLTFASLNKLKARIKTATLSLKLNSVCRINIQTPTKSKGRVGDECKTESLSSRTRECLSNGKAERIGWTHHINVSYLEFQDLKF